MKDYKKYYTSNLIANTLIEFLPSKEGKKVIDICCGTGNLLKEFQSRNNNSLCYGVDINHMKVEGIVFFQEDGRLFALKSRSKYDFVLANPPFGKEKERKYTEKLFKGKYKDLFCSRLEIEMLVSNLILLKRDGCLLIILPHTFKTGIKYLKTRRYLATSFHIDYVIDLPYNAFAPEHIRCIALIIEKKRRKTPTLHYLIDENYKKQYIESIPVKEMTAGNWVMHTSKTSPPFSIIEGSVSSRFFCDDGFDVLHTSGKRDVWEPSIRKTNYDSKTRSIIASSGDIVISRIGASAGQKCLYRGEDILVSDCLFVIKEATEIVKGNIMKMNLESLVCGLATPYITAKDIYQLYNTQYSTGV